MDKKFIYNSQFCIDLSKVSSITYDKNKKEIDILYDSGVHSVTNHSEQEDFDNMVKLMKG